MTGAVLAPSPAEGLAPPGPVVVLTDLPEVEVAGLVAAGHSLAQATRLWVERTEPLLGLLRRHRRRLLMVSRSAVQSQPQAFVRAISVRFAPSLQLPPEILAEDFSGVQPATQPAPIDPIMTLVVTSALLLDARCAPLAREVEAMLTGLADDAAEAPGPSLTLLAERAAAHHDALCGELAASAGNRVELEAENRLLAEQMWSMRSDIEYLIREQDGRGATLGARESDLATLRARLARTEEEHRRTLALAEDRAAAAEAFIAEITAEQEAAMAHADALLGSASWRITAPLRGPEPGAPRRTGDRQ